MTLFEVLESNIKYLKIDKNKKNVYLKIKVKTEKKFYYMKSNFLFFLMGYKTN